MKYYAGIGARDTPSYVLDEMKDIASFLKRKGWTLRSGGARGADTAFALGAGSEAEIFLEHDYIQESMDLAEKFHPAWNRLNGRGQRLMARNNSILLGIQWEAFVEFVVCWTPFGEVRGGTGQGLRVANHFGIEIINLATREFPYERFYNV